MFEIKGKYTTAKVMIDKLDSETISQIQNFVNDKSFTNPVAIMPDAHAGKGSVIGFTMPVDMDHVIPNTIGVDIGCGMLTLPCRLNLTYEDIDKMVRDRVPMGTNVHKKGKDDTFKEIFEDAKRISESHEVNKMFPGIRHKFYNSFREFVLEMERRGIDLDRAKKSIGTLGGGNHFIEFGISQKSGDVFCTIHTGSRRFGLGICNYWQKVAKDIGKRFDEREYNRRVAEIVVNTKDKRQVSSKIVELKEKMRREVPVKGFEFLYGEFTLGYLCDMIIAQEYAKANRECIAGAINPCFDPYGWIEIIDTVHNFISFKDGVIRKGSISAHKGEKVIIPFNSAYGVLVCEGKGNKEWNNSAPHGAGRLYARGQAKRELNMDKFRSDMKEVYSSSVTKKNLDESPEAYKDPEIVINAIEPTVKIVDRIKPFINIKA